MQQAAALQPGGVRDDVYLPGKAAGRCRDLMVWIAKKVGVIKSPFAGQTLGVDCEPPAIAEIKNVAMMNIAMQTDNIARAAEQHARCIRTARKNAACIHGIQ